VRAPQRGHPGLSAGPPRDAQGLPGNRAAGAHPWRHGALFLRAGGDPPPPGPESRQGPQHRPGAGRQGHYRPGRRPQDPG